MKLRSGKTYATTCYICKEYYGTDETPVCSLCKKGKDGVLYDYHSPVFQEKLKKYAESKMIGKAEQKFLIKISNKGNDNGLLEALKNLKNNYGLRLSAEFAHKLLFKTGAGYTSDRVHIICPTIVDWWNITKENKWCGTAMCYYGRFGEAEHIIKSIPPPATFMQPGFGYWKNRKVN